MGASHARMHVAMCCSASVGMGKWSWVQTPPPCVCVCLSVCVCVEEWEGMYVLQQPRCSVSCFTSLLGSPASPSLPHYLRPAPSTPTSSRWRVCCDEPKQLFRNRNTGRRTGWIAQNKSVGSIYHQIISGQFPDQNHREENTRYVCLFKKIQTLEAKQQQSVSLTSALPSNNLESVKGWWTNHDSLRAAAPTGKVWARAVFIRSFFYIFTSSESLRVEMCSPNEAGEDRSTPLSQRQ